MTTQTPNGKRRRRFDRGRESETLPLPPNRTGGSPASGSPVGGLTRKGTDEPRARASRKLVHPCLAEPVFPPPDRSASTPSQSSEPGGRQQPHRPDQRFDT